jgi:hypothetical protein
MSTPAVVEYGIRPVRPRNLTDLNAQIRDTHTTGVAMGAAGPMVLFTAFLSSSAVLVYQGLRGAAGWIQRKVQSGRT